MATPKTNAKSLTVNHMNPFLTDEDKENTNHSNISIIPENPFSKFGAINLSISDEHNKDFLQDLSRIQSTHYPAPLPSYNPNKCPPDLDKAEEHALAHSVYHFDSDKHPNEFCESTGLPIYRKNIPFFFSLDKVTHFGPVIPMFFKFSQQLIIISFLLACGALSFLVSNLNKDHEFSYQEVIHTLIIDKNQNWKFLLSISGLLFILFVLAYFFRRSLKQTKMNCKKNLITPSDYTVMASNIGDNFVNKEVNVFFSDHIISGFSLDVKKVTFTYDIEKYVQRIRDLKKLLKEKEEINNNSNYIASGMADEVQNKINNIKDFFQENKNRLQGFRGLNRNGLCFISYGSKQEAKTIRRRFECSGLERSVIWLLDKVIDEFPEYFFKGNQIGVCKAPEFDEIIWENLNCNQSRKGTSFLSLLIYATILATSFASIYYIASEHLIPVSNPIYIIGLIVFIINELLAFTVSFNAGFLPFKTLTDYRIYIQRTSILLQFVNTAGSIYSLESVNITNANFASNILTIFAVTSLLPLIVRLINIPHIQKSLLKGRVTNQVQSSSNSNGITQEITNHAFEKTDFNLSRAYTDLIHTLLVACLFFAVSPAVAIIAVCSLFLGYNIDKYNFLRRSLIPTYLNSDIAEKMFEFVDFAFLLLAISGNMLFNSIVEWEKQNIFRALTVMTTIFAATYFVLPNKRIARNCFASKKKVSWQNILLFEQVTEFFNQDFQALNHLCNQDADPREVRTKYQDVQNEFKVIGTLSEVPELLPIFNYSKKKPGLSCLKDEEGLKNPYFIFPQSYGFGLAHGDPDSHFIQIGQNKVPLLIDQPPSMMKAKTNETTPAMLELANSLDSKEKSGPFSQSVKGGSIMKDIMMISSHPTAGTSEFEFHEVGSHEARSPAFGGLNAQTLALGGNSYLPASASMNDIGILEGVSPISKMN